jgi:hypothetical protein
MINVIYVVCHVSIRSTSIASSSYHIDRPIDPTRRRIIGKLVFFIQDKD